jgi:hypothetical protein
MLGDRRLTGKLAAINYPDIDIALADVQGTHLLIRNSVGDSRGRPVEVSPKFPCLDVCGRAVVAGWLAILRE